MRMILATVLGGLTILVPTLARAEIPDSVRLKAEQACYDDVNRMCGDAIPDEEKIKVCMTAHRAQLNPKCKAIFDANMK